MAPELVFNAPGWDDELLSVIGDQDVSIENSVAISGNTVYFANSGGLVQGWDITGLAEGQTPQRTFRFWTGDDTDATIVIDDEGMLYVASEYERGNEQARTNGQLMKLDPTQAGRPARLEGRRPRHAAVGHLGDAGHPRRHGLRVDRRRVASSASTRRPARSCGRRSSRAPPGSRRWSSTTC